MIVMTGPMQLLKPALISSPSTRIRLEVMAATKSLVLRYMYNNVLHNRFTMLTYLDTCTGKTIDLLEAKGCIK